MRTNYLYTYNIYSDNHHWIRIKLYYVHSLMGTAVAQWLRRCATNRKVAGSIPAVVSGFFN